MRGANIRGSNKKRESLFVDLLHVGGDAFLDNLKAIGAVRLLGSHIAGQLDMSGSTLPGADSDGDSLVGEELKVDGQVLLNGGFLAAGTVRLVGAHIAGLLNMTGTKLAADANGGGGLTADRLQVDGNVLLNEQFTAAGVIRLLNAQVGGQLNFGGATLTRGWQTLPDGGFAIFTASSATTGRPPPPGSILRTRSCRSRGTRSRPSTSATGNRRMPGGCGIRPLFAPP